MASDCGMRRRWHRSDATFNLTGVSSNKGGWVPIGHVVSGQVGAGKERYMRGRWPLV